MRVGLNWLKDFVDIEMSPHELGELLTMIGLEVEGVEPVGQSLQDIVAAEILAVAPHPHADHLFLCQVDTGTATLPIVCGAPNLETGAKVPLALPGTTLPDGSTVEESQIRGETSKGMLLAEDEMGLTDDHTGILILPSNSPPGASLPSVLPVSDWVFDIDITPNRPDCASVTGIAREIAAATGKALNRPEIEMEETGPPIDELTRVTILDPDGCPRYAAGMIQGVTLGPSPFWIRYRLYQSGIRSLGNVVDVTNYVLLERGQPLHAFDYDRLKQNRIEVKRASDGDVFTTLDGETRKMDKATLMICDGERPVALAGIMGGLNSEIFAGTQNVLVESACFDPITIRRTAKRLGLSTEASYRFERGIDIDGVMTALTRSVSLIHQLAGGRIATGVIDNYPKVRKTPRIDLRVDRTNQLLGTSISRESMGRYLRALEMGVEEKDPNVIRVEPPSFRVDITREVDLVEEVARLDGFDNIPVSYPSIRPSEQGEPPERVLRDRMRQIMVGMGFAETITYSFISPDSADMLGAAQKSALRSFVRLLNPLSREQSVMRTSLIPGLMATARTNILNEERELKLFEWGKVFIRIEGDEQPAEKLCLGGLITGPYRQKPWYEDERRVDFYDIKGEVEALLKAVGIRDLVFQVEGDVPGFDPELCAGIHRAEVLLGHAGRVSPDTMRAYDLEDEEAWIFELDIDALLTILPKELKFEPFAKFPAVYRDISLIVDRHTESAGILKIAKSVGGDLVESVRIFDLYEGEKMDPSEKALAFRICYRSREGTLDGVEVNRLHGAIIDRIRQETGGRLREG